MKIDFGEKLYGVDRLVTNLRDGIGEGVRKSMNIHTPRWNNITGQLWSAIVRVVVYRE